MGTEERLCNVSKVTQGVCGRLGIESQLLPSQRNNHKATLPDPFGSFSPDVYIFQDVEDSMMVNPGAQQVVVVVTATMVKLIKMS